MFSPAQEAALHALKTLPPRDLFNLRDAILDAIRAADYPSLGVRPAREGENAPDGVVFTAPPEYTGSDHEVVVTPDELTAIDVSERWTQGADVDADEKTLTWSYLTREDYNGLVYTYGDAQPVHLPEGWSEE